MILQVFDCPADGRIREEVEEGDEVKRHDWTRRRMTSPSRANGWSKIQGTARKGTGPLWFAPLTSLPARPYPQLPTTTTTKATCMALPSLLLLERKAQMQCLMQCTSRSGRSTATTSWTDYCQLCGCQRHTRLAIWNLR